MKPSEHFKLEIIGRIKTRAQKIGDIDLETGESREFLLSPRCFDYIAVMEPETDSEERIFILNVWYKESDKKPLLCPESMIFEVTEFDKKEN